jgi:hypothetical protein
MELDAHFFSIFCDFSAVCFLFKKVTSCVRKLYPGVSTNSTSEVTNANVQVLLILSVILILVAFFVFLVLCWTWHLYSNGNVAVSCGLTHF